ncbi:hypothetical protein [Thermus scotoductus]|uniref:Uncharacterized protein n=1 Tax=Thermus scotoductus TaxID=37636 RepID=A0A430UUD2_THESC|nr:hypothetical protein [Thermus scotoductus]RTI12176.1 hypothetical protein CSW27_10840 [Thermus scotoductus]RTI12438.1 hypothetical protein CSW30_01070 [Thermus scotoductus]
MMVPARVLMVVLALTVGLALADSPDEARMSGRHLARSAVAFLQAEPPNPEMALDRLRDALEKPEGVDVKVLELALEALEAGVPQAVPPLVAKAVGDDPGSVGGSKAVEVHLGPTIYWAFAIGLVLVFLGAYALGRSSALLQRKEA